MKRSLALAAALGVIGALASSCLVDRRTRDLACDDQNDCTDDRICDSGFCVLPTCPSQCDFCDLEQEMCTINCDDPNECGNVTCPAGFECNINCRASNACDNVDCSAARDCDIECDGSSACGNIDCGTGRCDVFCDGSSACGVIECSQACDCDAQCNGDCDGSSCPTPTSGAGDCEDGTGGCDSNQPNCERTCP